MIHAERTLVLACFLVTEISTLTVLLQSKSQQKAEQQHAAKLPASITSKI